MVRRGAVERRRAPMTRRLSLRRRGAADAASPAEPPTPEPADGPPAHAAPLPARDAEPHPAPEAPPVQAPAPEATAIRAPAAEATAVHTPVPAVHTAAPVVHAAAPVVDPSAPAGLALPTSEEPGAPSFRDRGRLRRRLRYLRRIRELGFRDLGGLEFDLHRFGREGTALVAGKLEALAAVDVELRALEERLDDRREVVILREAGIAACPRCAALHGSDANFCPNCGLRLDGPQAMSEVGDAPAAAPAGPLPTPAAP